MARLMKKQSIKKNNSQSMLVLKQAEKFQNKKSQEIKKEVKNQRAGEFPYRRGLYPSLQTDRLWTLRQYAGFSNAKDSNEFYHQNLRMGQTGLSVAFDLPTHRGFDADDKRAWGDVGLAGVSVSSVEDMKLLFDKIPLNKISVSMTMNGAVLPILASYIVAAEESGAKQNELSGTIQNDILKEFLVRNTYIYPPEPSMAIVADIINYCTLHMPKFHPISISGYHLGEAGATIEQELAYTLCNGLAYIRAGLETGLAVDDFAPRLSFFFGIGMDFFKEIAKLRAARQLWAELLKEQFGAKNPKSWMLRMHCQTSGVSLTRQDPYNNIIRTSIEALAAVLGGTQSLHTNSFDEAIALPSVFSARLARNTQLILQKEIGLQYMSEPDPLGGSYYLEKLTDELIVNARQTIKTIENLGGMLSAIKQKIPQNAITSEAIKKQNRFEDQTDIIVGVNAYQLAEPQAIPTFHVDNQAVQQEQAEKLATLRQHRNKDLVATTLQELKLAAKNGKGLLAATIKAIRARASLGEVSSALTEIYGRYDVKPELLPNIYSENIHNLEEKKRLKILQDAIGTYRQKHQKKPTILISKLGLDGHDRGAKLVASALSDCGFHVVLAPLFQLPSDVAKLAKSVDADVIGISSHTAGHKLLLPELITELQTLGLTKVKVIAGGIIPDNDKPDLLRAGVAAIFDPASDILTMAETTLNLCGVALGHNR